MIMLYYESIYDFGTYYTTKLLYCVHVKTVIANIIMYFQNCLRNFSLRNTVRVFAT